jgi:hypothetical protein
MTYLYGYLLSDSVEQFAANEISFVTFNYDRSVEHFLSVSLSKTHGKSLEDCARVFDNIPVIHLHGRLGFLPWQNAKLGRQFDGELDKHAMDVSRREIKVVHEDITDRDSDFSQAKKLLGEAKRIYLLGFGFGSKNVERLGLKVLSPEVFQATTSGLTDRERSQISSMVDGKIHLFGTECIGLLRNFAVLN